MFTTQSFPFKFATYKKAMVSPKSKATLLSSFSCAHYPHMVMLGSMFGDQLSLCKKNEGEKLVVDDIVMDCENRDMSLENFIGNFKASDGLDFIVIRIPAFFLITRQKDRRVKIYMTTGEKYVEVFSDPDAQFGKLPETNKYYGCSFDCEILAEERAEAEPNPNEAVVEFEEPIDEVEFENLLQADGDLRRIRIGKVKAGEVEFLNFPLEKTTNSELQEILKKMHESTYDMIEILGNTKIAGIRREGEFVWYAEIQEAKEAEHLYIKEMNAVFKDFCEKVEETEEEEEE